MSTTDSLFSDFHEPGFTILASWTDYRNFAKQVMIFTHANLKARYRKTIAGFIWVVLNPIIMYGVQALVFKDFLRLQVPNYALFLLSGLLPWIFMVQSMDMCTAIFLNSAPLLKSFQVNPLVYLVAQIVDNGINFLAAFLLLLFPIWIAQPSHSALLLLLPIAIVSLLMGTFGMCWLLSVAQVFFRDTRFLLQFVTSIGFFLTPIFYSLDLIPQKYRWIVIFNPFYRLLQPFRAILSDLSFPHFIKAMEGSLLCSGILLASSIYLWKKKRNAIYFNI